jgi:hypothetical protein
MREMATHLSSETESSDTGRRLGLGGIRKPCVAVDRRGRVADRAAESGFGGGILQPYG